MHRLIFALIALILTGCTALENATLTPAAVAFLPADKLPAVRDAAVRTRDTAAAVVDAVDKRMGRDEKNVVSPQPFPAHDDGAVTGGQQGGRRLRDASPTSIESGPAIP